MISSSDFWAITESNLQGAAPAGFVKAVLNGTIRNDDSFSATLQTTLLRRFCELVQYSSNIVTLKIVVAYRLAKNISPLSMKATLKL